MTFGEYCREYYRQEHGTEIPDWQVDIFDQYYEMYKSCGPNAIINLPRGNAKTNQALALMLLLNAYLEEEKNGDE